MSDTHTPECRAWSTGLLVCDCGFQERIEAAPDTPTPDDIDAVARAMDRHVITIHVFPRTDTDHEALLALATVAIQTLIERGWKKPG